MYQISEARGLAWAPAAGVYWIRRNGLEWSKVEPAPGERRWKAVDKLETELQAAYDADLQTILVVRRAPDWAQKVPGFSCGPVAPDALDALAQFMADAVERYKDPPYGVKYWEIGNEPDVDPSFVVPNSPYGCWGDQEDPFYGGEYYAQMLQAVYPAIKAADPEAQVLIGGLLLASDPAVDESPNPQGHFLGGILKGGGGEYFDIVSFHAYPWYKGQVLDWEQDVPVWQARGGIVVGKIDFLREVLAAYGYDKPLMLTEAGLVCPKCSSPPSPEFLEAQAAYVPRLFVRNMALGLEATVWYTLDGPGWRQAQLLETKDEPRPAYYAYKTMVSLLDDTVYLRPVDEFAGLTGYAFQRPDGEVWVLWSPEDTSVSIPIPAGLQQVYDLMGAPQSIDGAELTIGFAPVYLELSSTP